MSQYYGDIQLGDTIEWLFTTVNSSGVPTILTGTPGATAYTDGGATQSATGVTLAADFDTVTGLNKITVVATSGNGFAAGENIEIVLDAGTVDGNSVVGYAVGSFSIENRSNLRPTTVGNNEVDVTATGAVGIDWGNVENKTTANDLSATDIQLCDTITTYTGNTVQTGDSFARLGAPAGASVSADILEIEAQTRIIKKNETQNDFYFLMVDSTDNVTPKTGLTVTAQRSLDGAAFGAGTGTGPTELSNGIYYYDASAADLNADSVMFRFSSAGAADTFLHVIPKP